MIYPKLETKKEKKFTVDNFSTGIDKTREDVPIADCKNMIYSTGALKSRPNIETTEWGIFYEELPNCINKTEVCDAVIFLNGKYYKVAVFSAEEQDVRMFYNFFLLSEEGEAIKVAPLEFTRVSSNEFNRPESITVFSASRKFGCGIYAFVSIQNQSAQIIEEAYSLKMFELSTNMQEWISIKPSDMYIPKYYVNGRGVFYEQSALDLPKPEYKESINMLNNSFQCTYNSDGMSKWFYLPENLIKEGDLEYFNCKVYLDEGQMLEFNIDPERNVSNVLVYNGEQIYATYTTVSNCLRFQNFVPPIASERDNNIVITVRLKKPQNYMKFASINKGIWYSSREAGAYLCLAGNKYNPSQICVSAKDTPFYFPEGNCYLVGDPSQKITGLAKQNKALVIFKEKEIYCADCASDKFTVTHLHASIGCDLPSTIALCENRLVWANSDNKVYTLNALSDYGAVAVYGMSRAVDEYLAAEDFSSATACYCNRRYYLFLKNSAYVLDLSGALLQSNREFVTAAAWFKWEFPGDAHIKTSYKGKNCVNLICSIVGRGHYYIATLAGNDGIDKVFDESLNVKKMVVESTVSTGLFYDDNYYNKKLFTKMFANIFSERDIFAEFINEMGNSTKNTVINIKYNGKKAFCSYRVLPLVRSLGIAVRLRAFGNVQLNKLTFFYKETV